MNTSKKFKSLFAGALLFLLAALVTPFNLNAQATIKGDATEETKQKIQGLNQQMAEAFRSGDMVKVSEFYADDATVIIPGGKKIEGRKAIYEYLATLKNSKDFKAEVSDVNGSGKILYQVGTITFTADKNGTLETHSSDQVKVWKRGTDWDYKISVDSYN
ncbi:MAG TPA: nuclear transport factor 2 family protein [Bacteroidia bacterium]|nr:nuclear transport factor 2 family protein [Bacteroidia bacterium]